MITEQEASGLSLSALYLQFYLKIKNRKLIWNLFLYKEQYRVTLFSRQMTSQLSLCYFLTNLIFEVLGFPRLHMEIAKQKFDVYVLKPHTIFSDEFLRQYIMFYKTANINNQGKQKKEQLTSGEILETFAVVLKRV